jgi:hypothetical protein
MSTTVSNSYDCDALEVRGTKTVGDARFTDSKLRFEGFDGNHERQFGIATFIVKKLDRFDRFEGRSLNSRFSRFSR